MGVYPVQIDLATVQLLQSRLFHDLIGAASAIGTGLEFMADDAADGAALGLVQQSADRLTRRLDFYRAAYGLGGGRQGNLSLEDAVTLSDAWYADAKAALTWPSADVRAALGSVPPMTLKVLMIMTVLAEECLPRGGEVTVQLSRLPEGMGMAVIAAGTGARPPDGVLGALAVDEPAEPLSARSVVAFFAACLAGQQGGRIEAAAGADTVEFATLMPAL